MRRPCLAGVWVQPSPLSKIVLPNGGIWLFPGTRPIATAILVGNRLHLSSARVWMAAHPIYLAIERAKAAQDKGLIPASAGERPFVVVFGDLPKSEHLCASEIRLARTIRYEKVGCIDAPLHETDPPVWIPRIPDGDGDLTTGTPSAVSRLWRAYRIQEWEIEGGKSSFNWPLPPDKIDIDNNQAHRDLMGRDLLSGILEDWVRDPTQLADQPGTTVNKVPDAQHPIDRYPNGWLPPVCQREAVQLSLC